MFCNEKRNFLYLNILICMLFVNILNLTNEQACPSKSYEFSTFISPLNCVFVILTYKPFKIKCIFFLSLSRFNKKKELNKIELKVLLRISTKQSHADLIRSKENYLFISSISGIIKIVLKYRSFSNFNFVLFSSHVSFLLQQEQIHSFQMENHNPKCINILDG